MEDTNLYNEIISNFEKEKEINEINKQKMVEKERNLEKEWKQKHPILSSFLNYRSG